MTPDSDRAPSLRRLAKAHAYGNDFLYLPAGDWPVHDAPALAREMCERHAGAGADGLIVYWPTPEGARMRLLNADGESVRGVGQRRAGTRRARGRRPAARRACCARPGRHSRRTRARRRCICLGESGARLTFRAAMGQPEGIERRTMDVGGEIVGAIVLRVGNPQCVVLEPRLDEARYRRLGPLLERHPVFPAGTNVEFACVERPDLVRILIWERGVGPTLASGHRRVRGGRRRDDLSAGRRAPPTWSRPGARSAWMDRRGALPHGLG